MNNFKLYKIKYEEEGNIYTCVGGVYDYDNDSLQIIFGMSDKRIIDQIFIKKESVLSLDDFSDA